MCVCDKLLIVSTFERSNDMLNCQTRGPAFESALLLFTPSHAGQTVAILKSLPSIDAGHSRT